MPSKGSPLLTVSHGRNPARDSLLATPAVHVIKMAEAVRRLVDLLHDVITARLLPLRIAAQKGHRRAASLASTVGVIVGILFFSPQLSFSVDQVFDKSCPKLCT